MAEFCLKCWREIILPDGEQYEDDEFIYFTDLCEGCGEIKTCADLKRGPIARLRHRLRTRKKK